MRYDYNKIGLAKTEGTTKFDGMGINDLGNAAIQWIANYGLFVFLTRSLAGHEKMSDADKKDIVAESFQWLLDGMPARERSKADAFTSACMKVWESDAKKADKLSTIKTLEVAFGKKFELPE
jgi:hypothetical protein